MYTKVDFYLGIIKTEIQIIVWLGFRQAKANSFYGIPKKKPISETW